jgi:hypothetical protein
MRLNFCAAVWVVVALCSACRSRALPVPDDTNIPDPQGGGGTGGAAAGDAGLGGAGGVAGTAGGAGLGGVAGTTAGAGLEGLAGTTGGAGLGGAGATTGGAGSGGSAGGAGGAAGMTPAGIVDCPPATIPGQPCVVGSVCSNVVCHVCSDQYWHLVRDGLCGCQTGVWLCSGGNPTRPAGDCFFDPPLECDLAQTLYVDAACQTHPPCSASTPP